jgi:hypothetical protein
MLILDKGSNRLVYNNSVYDNIILIIDKFLRNLSIVSRLDDVCAYAWVCAYVGTCACVHVCRCWQLCSLLSRRKQYEASLSLCACPDCSLKKQLRLPGYVSFFLFYCSNRFFCWPLHTPDPPRGLISEDSAKPCFSSSSWSKILVN